MVEGLILLAVLVATFLILLRARHLETGRTTRFMGTLFEFKETLAAAKAERSKGKRRA